VAATGAGGWEVVGGAAQIIVGELTYSDTTSPAGSAWSITSPLATWLSVAVSGNGKKVAAGASAGALYTSDDFGATWTLLAPTPLAFSTSGGVKAAVSADGLTILAMETAATGSSLFVSRNWTSGPWVRSSVTGGWLSICLSADGSSMYATMDGSGAHGIYGSTDFGLTWTQLSTFDAGNSALSIACSSDGSKLVAGGVGLLKTSSDGGSSWTAYAAAGTWGAVASSGDGTKLTAGYLNTASRSVDGGATWTNVYEGHTWTGLASSSDGSRVLASPTTGPLHVSTDSGATWADRAPDQSWKAVASSSDGDWLFGVGSSYIYRSYRAGTTVVLKSATRRLVGAQYSAVELIYAGSNRFLILNSIGSPVAQ
jgi:hypothetical protein